MTRPSASGFGSRGRPSSTLSNDVLESWVATDDFISRRFVQDFVENDKPKHRHLEIFADSGFFREVGKDETEPTPPDPLDDAAFFYFVRITPLEVGKKYVFQRYFRKDKNPVTIEVMKREKMELPDGREVNCLVLHPVIDTQGLFSKRSDTRIWLTDDARRLPVQIRTKFPFGTITLRLKEMVLAGDSRHGPRIERVRVPYQEQISLVSGRSRSRHAATRSTRHFSPLSPDQPAASRNSSTAFPTCWPPATCARSSMASPSASRAGRGVVLLVGGHVIKIGLGPLIRLWIEHGVVTHLALNGAAAIHDFELAAYGGTSEDVESGLADGTFGMSEETGRDMNAALPPPPAPNQGMGEGLAAALAARASLPGGEASVLLAAHRAWTSRSPCIPLSAPRSRTSIRRPTVPRSARPAIATSGDWRDRSPALHQRRRGAQSGECGGVAGSLPQGADRGAEPRGGRPTQFLAADFDMQRHYRPAMNVVQRPTLGGGTGYLLTGHHEITHSAAGVGRDGETRRADG